MTIKLSKDEEKRLTESIKRYFAENMDGEIGDLKAALLLDFCLMEVGPCVYNRAIADAQALMLDKVQDLDGTCHQQEFDFWKE